MSKHPPTNYNPPFNITRASHLVFTARDLKVSKAFYTEVVGLVVSDESDDTLWLHGVEERCHHSLTLKKTKGDTDTDKLIATMEGMSFETPKGKMTFRKEDHQAMQSMYHFKVKADGKDEWDLLDLVREIPASEMPVPIRNKR